MFNKKDELEMEKFCNDDQEKEPGLAENKTNVESASGGIKENQTLTEQEIEEWKTRLINAFSYARLEEFKKETERFGKGFEDLMLQLALPTVLTYPDSELEYEQHIFPILDELKNPSEALMNNFDPVMALVIENREYPTYLHHIASTHSSQRLMDILQKYPKLVQPIINQPYEGETPLLIAAKFNNAEIAKRLVQCNADFTMKNSDGQTAIYLIALQGQAEVMNEIFQAVCPHNFCQDRS